jgi:hypothetical protein
MKSNSEPIYGINTGFGSLCNVKISNENLSKLQENLVKSRQRISDHGEVFTPGWMVEDMLNLVQSETERIDSRFLEPACGSGNFLKNVLSRKFKIVNDKYGKSDFEKRHYALYALMCIYGIELLKDNVDECRSRLLSQFVDFLDTEVEDVIIKAAETVLNSNIIQGDALTLSTAEGKPIEFPEWGYLGNGKFQRRDFRYDALTQRTGISGTLFEILEEHELFIPTKSYPQMTIAEITK